MTKAIPYYLRKNAEPHPNSLDSVNPADTPKIVLTRLHLDVRQALFDAGADTEKELFMLHRNTQDAILRVLSRCLEAAEYVMDEGGYPDRASDRDLLILSYQLPMPLALALLRKRLIRGLALRDMAEASAERREAAGVSHLPDDRLKLDREAA